MKYLRYAVFALAIGAGAIGVERCYNSAAVSHRREMDVEEFRSCLHALRGAMNHSSVSKRKKAIYRAAEIHGKENIFNTLSTLRIGDSTYGEKLAERKPMLFIDPEGQGFDEIADLCAFSPETSGVLDQAVRKPIEQLEADYRRGKHEIYERVLSSQQVPEEAKQRYRRLSEREQEEWEKERVKRLEKMIRDREKK